MIIDNDSTCPHCGSLLHIGESTCQVCGKAVKVEQREE